MNPRTGAAHGKINLDRHAVIALGANLGDPAATVQAAFASLRSLSAASVLTSSLWRSEPVDCPPGSPPFINAIAAVVPHTGETPESLLRHLQALERAAGRRPKIVMNEARPLDLDLIAFRRETRKTPVLTLPHPRAHQRAFVLAPLVELAPELVIPGRQETVVALLGGLPAAVRAGISHL